MGLFALDTCPAPAPEAAAAAAEAAVANDACELNWALAAPNGVDVDDHKVGGGPGNAVGDDNIGGLGRDRPHGSAGVPTLAAAALCNNIALASWSLKCPPIEIVIAINDVNSKSTN